MPSHNLPKVIQGIQETAERLMEQNTSAAAVLHGIINQYAMPLLRYKQTGQPPDMDSLAQLAGKLAAIVAATYDSMDAAKGKLP